MPGKPTLLLESHKLEDFDSGKPSLDTFLKNTAIENQREGHSRTFVVVDANSRVIGFHALCSGMMSRDNAPRQIGGHGAPKDISVALLARLAVDRNHQGRQLGTLLLYHAFSSVLSASEFVGFRAVMVHALDDEGVTFYKKFGFRSAKGLERTLLISLPDVAQIIQRSLAPR
jgi:GNAT superfamily N-acetyltransferase